MFTVSVPRRCCCLLGSCWRRASLANFDVRAPQAARAAGFPAREAALVGAMMNTRGLMELVVINVGYELRVVPRSVYCMLVLMALVTTVMTTPIVRRLASGTELEEPVRKSGFFA